MIVSLKSSSINFIECAIESVNNGQIKKTLVLRTLLAYFSVCVPQQKITV